MQNSNPNGDVGKDPNDQEDGGFDQDHGSNPGEVEPTGPGSEDLTDQEDGGFGEQQGPGDGETDPSADDEPRDEPE